MGTKWRDLAEKNLETAEKAIALWEAAEQRVEELERALRKIAEMDCREKWLSGVEKI